MISKELMNEIEEINSLIKDLDENKEKSNNYSLESMKEHIEEIKELFLKKDEQWAAETADLLIHCLLLLNRNNYRAEKISELLNIRCKKFKEKVLNQLKAQFDI